MIRVLPDIVQNKIAAGEVVERPASAVKELVENALDAGAERISIEIEEGGLRLIRVADDGCGMSAEDLQLSIERHATSKIQDVEDIFKISTMGFRGEALPSIASVSRLSIASSLAGEPVANLLKITGGKVEGIQPAPPRKGTVVEVADLFFNTPARRKFMKSAGAEMGAINETVIRIALANPQIAFAVNGNGKKSLELPVHNTLEERIRALFGKDMELLPIDYTTSNGLLRISGFCSKPPESRGTSKFIYTMLNKRWIKHPGINKGVVDAYQGNLPPRRYPFAVLNFTVDPSEVDVNAHPTKEVVRFENNSLFVGGCRKALSQALDAVQGARRVSTEWAERVAGTSQTKGSIDSFIINNQARESSAVAYKGSSYKSAGNEESKRFVNPVTDYNNFNSEDFLEKTESIVESQVAAGVDQQLDLGISDAAEVKFIGQVGSKYIIVEEDAGVIFFDQHALHERWNYNRVLGRDMPVGAQGLLIPVEVELTAVEQGAAVEALDSLEDMGFKLSFAESRLTVTAHPEIIRPQHIEQIIRDVLTDIESTPIEQYKDRIRASLACRASVLFGTALSDEQCLELLRKLKSGELLTCPHGRPTRISFSWQELAGKFGR